MKPTITTLCAGNRQRMYSVDFFGDDVEVTVTAQASVVRRWIYKVLFLNRRNRHRLIVGLGVQWTPGGGDPPADTLQICVGRRCLILQLYYCNFVPRILRRFLMNSSFTFVGIWNNQDEKKLRQSRHGLEIGGNLVDVRQHLCDGLRRASFERIVEEMFGYEGVRLEREISMSDWDKLVLDDEQILQACVDVYVCFKLGVDEKLWELI